MIAKIGPTSQGVSLNLHTKDYGKRRAVSVGVDDHGNFYVRMWRMFSTTADECRVIKPPKLLKTAAKSVLSGTLQPAVLADYLDEHRAEWDATRDEYLWAEITSFLRKWQGVYDRRTARRAAK